jgi:hypothetical protein
MTLNCAILFCHREAVTIMEGFALCEWCREAWVVGAEKTRDADLWQRCRIVEAAAEYGEDAATHDIAVGSDDAIELAIKRWRETGELYPEIPRPWLDAEKANA